MRPVRKAVPSPRFPRTENHIAIFVSKLRVRYPPPKYNPAYDGSIDPADFVLNSLGGGSKKDLKRWCNNHSLKPSGSRRKMIKRIYLHWRASKFGYGDPQIGYGKGYEATKTPSCVCGFRRKADIVSFEKNREKQKMMLREQRHKLDKLWRDPYKRRFPRLRFPRYQ